MNNFSVMPQTDKKVSKANITCRLKLCGTEYVCVRELVGLTFWLLVSGQTPFDFSRVKMPCLVKDNFRRAI